MDAPSMSKAVSSSLPPSSYTSSRFHCSPSRALNSFFGRGFSTFPSICLSLNSSIKAIRSTARDSNSVFPSSSCLNSETVSPTSPFSCSATASAPPPPQATEVSTSKLELLVSEFESLVEPLDRVKRLLHYASLLPPFHDSEKTDVNRVMGCTAQVWVETKMDRDGRMRFAADSDSEITRGFCSCLVWCLDGSTPEEVLRLKTEDLASLNVGVGGPAHSRVNTWYTVMISMQKKTKALVAQRQGKRPSDPFPSLSITSDGFHPRGSYAEAQAKFLSPDERKVKELVNVLRRKKIGVVAHFYMDPEVQGVLTEAQKEWPHIQISDSLAMADRAVTMAEQGCEFMTVLGVDFMSENVAAILDQAGFTNVSVYRMSDEVIGCSLADAANSPSYFNYLKTASSSSPSLHMIYINTSLETKALSHELIPTIACTSSNVIQMILQAFAQIPKVNVWYGPDSCMGANIAEMFRHMSLMEDEEIAEIHPEHNRNSIRSLLPRLHYYQDGVCVVHDFFGKEMVERISEMHCDSYLTAHLEVPGEMFSLAMEARRRGMGVVGSTQNILDFIRERVRESLDRNIDDRLQFVLGTESGMITSIASAVRSLLSSRDSPAITVDIVFPVSPHSVTRTDGNGPSPGLPVIVPGPAAGDGCSAHGACASCPYMKMNTLSSLLRVCTALPDEKNILEGHRVARFDSRTPNGHLVADVGREPVLYMRSFQKNKKLPKKLVSQVLRSGMS